MTRLLVAAALLLLAGFVAGAIAMLELLDRAFGGDGIRIDVDEPGGGRER